LAFFAELEIFGTATVTAIPITTSVVIVVVAVAIAFPFFFGTTFTDNASAFVTLCYVRAVLALAICAIFVLVVGTAAVTLVPVATRVVVLIVTELISSAFFLTTSTFYGGDALVALSDVCAVLALAVFAVVVIFVTPAAVTVVPGTAGVVVVVIAIAVGLPFLLLATTRDLLNACIALENKLAVQALATGSVFCFAILVSGGYSVTAIAAIPVACTIVVFGIAELIAFAFCFPACAHTLATRACHDYRLI